MMGAVAQMSWTVGRVDRACWEPLLPAQGPGNLYLTRDPGLAGQRATVALTRTCTESYSVEKIRKRACAPESGAFPASYLADPWRMPPCVDEGNRRANDKYEYSPNNRFVNTPVGVQRRRRSASPFRKPILRFGSGRGFREGKAPTSARIAPAPKAPCALWTWAYPPGSPAA